MRGVEQCIHDLGTANPSRVFERVTEVSMIFSLASHGALLDP